MVFWCMALNSHKAAGKRIRAPGLFQRPSWKFWTCTRAVFQLSAPFLPYPFLVPIYLLLLFTRVVVKILSWCHVGDGSFASSITLRATSEIILSLILRLGSYHEHFNKYTYTIFWTTYFCVAELLETFTMDYCQALREQPETDAEIVLFVDNGYRLQIPCSRGTNDKDLVRLLRMFYELIMARRGVIQIFGFRTSARIDVVQLQFGAAVGPKIGPPLDLGRHGPYNRQIYFFRDSSPLHGTEIRDRLLLENVLHDMHTNSQQIPSTIAPLEQARALNIVRSWNPRSASVTVAIPVFCSFAVAIIWSAVCTLRYGADIQDSVQTGFTIGSYVVTTGAVLIALVAFLDTKYNSSEQRPDTSIFTSPPPSPQPSSLQLPRTRPQSPELHQPSIHPQPARPRAATIHSHSAPQLFHQRSTQPQPLQGLLIQR
ncbi:hypothetical protein PMIN02_008412 [Paraphaeosphaeria minitans]